MNLLADKRIEFFQRLILSVFIIQFVHATNNGTAEIKETENSSSGLSTVTIYTGDNFWGIPWTMTLSNCTDVPRLFYKKASSIDTHNNCMLLYSLQGCKGRQVKIEPGSDGHSKLSAQNFDKTLASIETCHNSKQSVQSSADKRTRRSAQVLSSIIEPGISQDKENSEFTDDRPIAQGEDSDAEAASSVFSNFDPSLLLNMLQGGFNYKSEESVKNKEECG